MPPKEIVKWKLADLTSHPRQDRLFRQVDDVELKKLAASLAVAQEQPVEILPNGTILDGHQRVRAATLLGWQEIVVWVRRDLADDVAASNRRHIEANIQRRQLDPLDKVRLAKALLEDEKRRKLGQLLKAERDALRDRIGKDLGLSGRHVQRLLNVANAPMAVQRAFSEGKIGVVVAEKGSRLPKSAQTQIAQEIDGGADPTTVIGTHLASETPPRPADASRVFGSLIRAIGPALEQLEGREDEIQRGVHEYAQDIALLNRLSVFIESVTQILEQKREAAFSDDWSTPLDFDSGEAVGVE